MEIVVDLFVLLKSYLHAALTPLNGIATIAMAVISILIYRMEHRRELEETPQISYWVVSEAQRTQVLKISRDFKLMLWNPSKSTFSILDHEIHYKGQVFRTTPRSFQFLKYQKSSHHYNTGGSNYTQGQETLTETKGYAHVPIVLASGAGIGLYFELNKLYTVAGSEPVNIDIATVKDDMTIKLYTSHCINGFDIPLNDSAVKTV